MTSTRIEPIVTYINGIHKIRKQVKSYNKYMRLYKIMLDNWNHPIENTYLQDENTFISFARKHYTQNIRRYEYIKYCNDLLK